MNQAVAVPPVGGEMAFIVHDVSVSQENRQRKPARGKAEFSFVGACLQATLDVVRTPAFKIACKQAPTSEWLPSLPSDTSRDTSGLWNDFNKESSPFNHLYFEHSGTATRAI